MVILGDFGVRETDQVIPSGLRNVRNTHMSTQPEENREAATSVPASAAADFDPAFIGER